MTTNFYRTRSNSVKLTDARKAKRVLQDYQLPDEAEINITDGGISIYMSESPGTGFDVYDAPGRDIERSETDETAKDEMYRRLAPCLTAPLNVRTVQTDGRGNSDVTITIHPDGEITRSVNNR